MAELQHIYDRAVDPDGQGALAKVARMIAPGSRVLDIGCGPGLLGDFLAHEHGCTVDGVDFDADAARVAALKLRQVVVADLETCSFDGLQGPYDYIVSTEVLERLRDPGALLRRLLPLLAPNGKLLLSIANIAYAGVVAGLLNGEFRYRSEGMLDAGHLRFFTRRSLHEWLTGLGLHVTAIDTVQRELADSEFAGEGLEGFAPALARQVLSMEDALTYQFIVQVMPTPSEPSLLAPVSAPAPAALTFPVQLYWRGSQPGFNEKRSGLQRAQMGENPQRVRIPFPSLPTQEFAFRLDLADRPGLLRLYDLAVYDANGACVWKWDGTMAQLERMPSNELSLVDDEQPGQLMVSLGEDPWLQLPFTRSDTRVLGRGGHVEVDLGWPMSTDSFAVARRLAGGGLRSALAAFDERRNQLLQELTTACEEQCNERERYERDRTFLERERQRLDEELRDLRAQQEDLLSELDTTRAELTALHETLRQINNSVTFRLGRPVHVVVNRFRELRKGKP